ncbi:hypothetical protein [Halocatena pleomorpha]|uniref:DUF8054 domain-containing protein n=1 Tax=Halocatena pleomorpha TaxID=1785090 RepID=A0A3P3R4J4_9EURY|nr:hypothetical protein [Halocatena pleomorpha]RRJ27878.1 hypothetical protein EIK79_17055 [Halocatena pleomorpha]
MTELVLPQGRLLRSRVVSDVHTVLLAALDRSLTGYAVVVPSRTNAAGNGAFTFDQGVPVLVYHAGTDTGGERALAAFKDVGPCRIDLYALSRERLRSIHDGSTLSVPPALPATYLTGDRTLTVRTRKRAARRSDTDIDTDSTGDDTTPPADHDAVTAFLADADRIETLREQARDEARQRAKEWDLDEQLVDNEDGVRS